MRVVALVEHDGLLREVLRERLEREGYEVCAVATVRAAVEGAQWSTYVAILLGASTAAGATGAQREALRALNVPTITLHRPMTALRAPDGIAATESLVCSSFDLEPVVQAVLRRALPGEPEPTRSGTYRRSSSAGVVAARRLHAVEPVAAKGEGVAVPLDVLGALVLEATGTRDK